MARRERRQIFLGELEQLYRRTEAPAVFRMRRMFEVFFEMNERARGLDQSFEKIVIRSVGVQPNLLEHIVRFVVELLVPAAKIRAIKRMIRNLISKIDIVALQLTHKLRNPLAFVHGALNFIMPQMMGKSTFPEGLDFLRDRSDE